MRATLIIKTLHLEYLLAQEENFREFDRAAATKEAKAPRINKNGPTFRFRVVRVQP